MSDDWQEKLEASELRVRRLTYSRDVFRYRLALAMEVMNRVEHHDGAGKTYTELASARGLFPPPNPPWEQGE